MSIELNGTTGIQFNDGSDQSTAATPYGRKNLIINGDMRIDQRNAGASVSVSSYGYVLDRFGFNASGGGIFNAQQTTTAPDGFSNSQQLTVTTADASIASGDTYSLFHKIEGYNTSHLQLGTANAKTFTMSFWVRSSVTGTFGVGFCNNAFNRSYISTYTIDTADTWEKKTITVAGDTSGTWTTNNSIGLNVSFDLGSGTNFDGTAGSWSAGNLFRTSGCVNWIATSGATFYITGVQLEVGDSASDFEFMPYDMELARCQRYYQCDFGGTWGQAYNSTTGVIGLYTYVPMRTIPSVSIKSGGTHVIDIIGGTQTGTAMTLGGLNSVNCITCTIFGLSGRATYQPLGIYHHNTELSAEL